MKFLVANGMEKGPTQLLELDGDDAVEALKQGKVDATFLMGETGERQSNARAAESAGDQNS